LPVVSAPSNHGDRGDHPIDHRSRLRRPARRSFLARVGGGLALGAAALMSGCRTAPSGLTDCDDGVNADARGNGRSGRSGFTDSDAGANADRPGCGRGTQGASITDSDRGRLADPAGRGRGNAQRYSDNDIGLAADPIGRGRRRGERRP